jgi:hypothetical protein
MKKRGEGEKREGKEGEREGGREGGGKEERKES